MGEDGSESVDSQGRGDTATTDGASGEHTAAETGSAGTDTTDHESVPEQYTDREDRLAVYEWMGGVAAGLGFFLTPILTGPVALYCAFLIRREKPLTALLVLAVTLSTVVFWLVVLIFVF